MQRKHLVIVALIIGIGGLLTPAVRTRLTTQLLQLESEFRNWRNPPEELVFVPSAPTVAPTIQFEPTPTLHPTPTPSLFPSTATMAPRVSATPTNTPMSTTTPTPTETRPRATPVPNDALISGIVYQHQHGLWNYCGPSNLAMLVSYWGSAIDRTEAGAFLRGSLERYDDKNVSPNEMARYIERKTELEVVVRHGGTIELLERLIANGYPVIIEAGYLPEGEAWMGHYLLLNAYDQSAQQFIAQDTYLGADTVYSYASVKEHWRAFNNLFIVAADEARLPDLMMTLGEWGDARWALSHAKDVAEAEIGLFSAETPPRFFAQFNLGTTLTEQGDYAAATTAYDQAFAVYAQLPPNTRPWRMLWYQFNPYIAYYHTERYQDVINLANTTLGTLSEPMLEESVYWRGMAREALGDLAGSEADFALVKQLNPNFAP